MQDIISKRQIIKNFKKKYLFFDLGTNNSKTSVNYPDYAHKVCKEGVKMIKIILVFCVWLWNGNGYGCK